MRRSLIGLAMLMASGQVLAQTPTTVAPPPSLINFQGRFARPDGTPVADGNTYAVTLSLWDAASGGSKKWEQSFINVSVRNGAFAVLLNLGSGFTSGNTLDTTLNNNTYLQVQLGNNAPLSPRQQLVSTAYALKAMTVPDGSISVSKLTSDLKQSVLGGAAGGDLTGSFPNPLIKTDPGLLNKVSGTLLYVSAATTSLDQSQPNVTATVTSSAWQSFTPAASGTLVEIDVNCGTTGAPQTTTLSLYSGEGTNSTALQTIPITISPTLGLQSFTITQAVTGNQKYTWAIGSNNNLIFGYTGGTAYAGGRSDLGASYDYAFQTRMRVTTAPANQINANAYFAQSAVPGPMLVKQYNPFIGGSNIGVGRFGLFQPDASTLFVGIPGADISGTSLRFGTWSGTGVRTDAMTVSNNGSIGIGTTTPQGPLHVAPIAGITIGQNPTAGGYTALSLGLSQASGGNAQIQAIKSSGSAFGDLILNPATAGNVGIGTASPDSKLHVAGDTHVNGKLAVGSTAPSAVGESFYVNGASRLTGNLRVDGTGGLILGGSGAGITFPDNTVQATAAVATGSAAGGDLSGTFPNPSLATKATSLAKVSGGAMMSNGSSIGIGTASPLQTLDVNGRINVTNGVIQRGGSAITSTSDLGLYSQVANNWIRFVTNGGPFVWFSDSGTGTNSIMNLDSGGNLSTGSLTTSGGITANNGNITTPNGSLSSINAYISNYASVGPGQLVVTAPDGNNNALRVFNNNNSNYPALYVKNNGGGQAGYFSGYLSSSDKRFMIDDPIDPENKYLVHGCVESDERRNIYDGTVALDDKGEATIQMPKWFEALNKDCRYQLTCIGGYAQVYVAEKMNNNHFKIAGGKPGLEVSWQVTGVRQDAWAKTHPMEIEQDKGEFRGKYLQPEAFGLPESRGGAMMPPMPKSAVKPNAPKPDATKLTQVDAPRK